MLSPERLASLRDRSIRDRERLFVAEGFRFLLSALRNQWPIEGVAFCPELFPNGTCRGILSGLDAGMRRLRPDEFLALSTANEPQGVLVLCHQRWSRLIDAPAGPHDVHLVLDEPRSPGNLGTMLRSCEAFRVQSVWLIGGEADPYEPKAVRASMGAIFSQRLVRTSFKAIQGWRKRHPCRFVAACPDRGRDVRDADLRGPVAIIMGNERTGIRPRQGALSDGFVRIPMSAGTDSLNLAVATSIVLHEAFQQGRSTSIAGSGPVTKRRRNP